MGESKYSTINELTVSVHPNKFYNLNDVLEWLTVLIRKMFQTLPPRSSHLLPIFFELRKFADFKISNRLPFWHSYTVHIDIEYIEEKFLNKY